MYQTRKRVRDEKVASSVQQSRVDSSRVRDIGAASSIRKSRAEPSRVGDDGVASSIRKSRPEPSRVRDDVSASSIRKFLGETSRGAQLAPSLFRNDNEEVYPGQDVQSPAMNDKVSAILESIKSKLPEGETSQWSAHAKAPPRPSDGGGIFWKDKSDLDAFRARADGEYTSRRQETGGELDSSVTIHKRLERLEQLLMSSQTASVMKQQEDHHNDSLMRLLGFFSEGRNVRQRQGDFEEVHRPTDISRVLEEVNSQVQPRHSPLSCRNLEAETIVPMRSSFPNDNSREVQTRVSSVHAKNRGIHGRTDSQLQPSPRLSSRSNLEPQISSRRPNSLSVVDALEALLAGNLKGNGRCGNIYGDTSHIGSHIQANRRESHGNLEQQISSPRPSPVVAMDDSPEECNTGNIMASGKQTKVTKARTRRKSQVRAKNRPRLNGKSETEMCSFQPNSLPAKDLLEDGDTVKNKRPVVHEAQNQVDSELQSSRRTQMQENSGTQVSAVPLNFLPLDDSPEMLGTEAQRRGSQNHGGILGLKCETDVPMQMLNPIHLHRASDSHVSSHAQSPKPREESPEVLTTGRRKRGRGLTRLDAVWNLPEGERIVCEFNEQCQPIKLEARLLTRFLGTVIRKPHLAPLDVKDWRHMPKEKKEEMWQIVESKFLIPAERKEEIKAWIITDLGDKWRNYKCLLRKQYFDETKPLSELVKLRPPFVDKDQWTELLNLWSSPKFKMISEASKKNRENHKLNHTSGTLSYAMVEEDMKDQNGVAPSKAQVFVRTHKRKDGTDVNEETAKAIEVFERLGSGDLGADDAGNAWENDTFCQNGVPGTLGRLLGKRKGSRGSKLWKSKRTITVSREDYRNTFQQQKEMKEQLQAQEERLKGLENKMSALLSTLQENLSQRDLVNILKKATTQAEAPCGSDGSDPDYQEPQSSFNY